MKTPFVYGRIATEDDFTDREDETRLLVTHFSSLVNTVIISPRRWGKSSLVNRAAAEAMSEDRDLRVCIIDLFNVRNEAHFYRLLAEQVLAATTSKWDEAVEAVKAFFKRIVPKVSINPDAVSEISLDFDWEEVKRDPDEVLDLAENIARKKGLKIVICIDEFQNLSQFDDPDFFQKQLRSHWQTHRHVSYCLYGSKRHMMLEFFTEASMPFYKFGYLMFLEKIGADHLISFFTKRFSETGKAITPEAAALIAALTDNHPYYAQQLAQMAWLRTEEECDSETVELAHRDLVRQLSLLFQNLTETLTTQQVNYLRALIAGETALTSADVLHRYRISSSTSAVRSKAALIKNDILDDTANGLAFQDPLYAFWLRTSYFK